MNGPTVLELRSVSLRYPGAARAVLENVSLQIGAGERVALFGLNGSGKTSLLLAIAGLLPFTGSIIVDGVPVVQKNLPAVRERLGLLFNVPEDQLLFPRIIDDVAFGVRQKGIPEAQAMRMAMNVLKQLGIADLAHLSPFQISHGQRQRVALAGAIVTNPALLLLDEPSSALDPPGRSSLVTTIRSLPSAILLATHDGAFAEAVCTRFLVIRHATVREYPDHRSAFAELIVTI